MNITEPLLQGRIVLWEFDCINSAAADGSPKDLMSGLYQQLLLQRSSVKDMREGDLAICLGRSCVLLCVPLMISRMVRSENTRTGVLGTLDKVPVVFDAHLPSHVIPTTKLQLALLPKETHAHA